MSVTPILHFYFCILDWIMSEKEKLRLDKYLWAIRLFKTSIECAKVL